MNFVHGAQPRNLALKITTEAGQFEPLTSNGLSKILQLEQDSPMRDRTKKVTLVVGLQLVIAAFFILGAGKADRSLYIIYQSYFADIFLPFGFYFLLSLIEDKQTLFKKWWIKGLFVLALCATSEILQYFGIFALARVFDSMDFVMYGMGVGLAVVVDRQIFPRFFSFWNYE